MKLRTKIHAINFASLVVLSISLGVTYDIAKQRYVDSTQNTVNAVIEDHKEKLVNPISYITQEFQNQDPLIQNLNDYARNRLKDDTSIPIAELKKELIDRFDLSKQKIQLNIINKDYVIDDSTDTNVLNYDLRHLPRVVSNLNQVWTSGETLVGGEISPDSTQRETYYRQFYMSKIDNERVLEIRFSIPLDINKAIQYNHKRSDVLVDIYSVYQKEEVKFDNFYYVPMNELQTSQDEDSTNSGPVISTFKTKTNTIRHVDDDFIVYSVLYDDPKSEVGYEGIVAKFTVNLNESKVYLSQVKKIFIGIFISFLIIWLMTFIVIRRYLVQPISIISTKVSKGVSVPLDNLEQNNEFRSFATIYNNLLDQFQEQLEKNERLLFTDHLTSALNRKAFDKNISEYLVNFIEKDERFSLLLIDIDNFKKVNDNFGHAKGDEILITLSQLAMEASENKGEFYRLGGEEFAFIFFDLSTEEVLSTMSAFMTKLQKHYIDLRDESITISGGLTFITKGDDTEVMYQRADELCYQAKNSGKNKVMV